MLDFLAARVRQFPVAINNMYGDPTLQWYNTVSKLAQLEKDQHLGPVTIITRGKINSSMAAELKNIKLPGLIVIVSYSNLGPKYEPYDSSNALATISELRKAEVPFIVNIRPLLPSENGTREKLFEIFHNIATAGAKNVIISGFRGNEEMICQLNAQERLEWNLRVKLLNKRMNQDIADAAEKFSLIISKRVSCGVALVKNYPYPWNPYYNSPILVGCADCSNKESCEARRTSLEVSPELIEALNFFGYDVSIEESEAELCQVTPDNRLKCPSCCTACFMTHNKKIWINNPNITLADTAFIRFLSGGVVGTQKGVIDCGGNTGIAQVLSATLKHPAYLVNSWWVWATNRSKCLGCSYCITQAYDIPLGEIGFAPARLLEQIADSA